MSSESTIRLKAFPRRTLMDESLEITISNLKSCQAVTVVAVTVNDEDGAAFYSLGKFQADSCGFLDINRSFSFGGTFVGVESMGLFWSAISAPGQKMGLRLIKRTVNTPLNWHIFVLDGISHDGVVEVLVSSVRNNEGTDMTVASSGPSESKVKLIGKSIIQRYYCYPESVRQIQVRDGRLRGILFVPVKCSIRPRFGLIDIYGGGSFKIHRAALLAERGYVVFGLAYCDFDDLSREPDIDVQYLVDAVEYMLSRRCPGKVFQGGLGIIGLCKGATLALELASVHPKIKAVVAINASCFNEIGRFRRLGSDEDIAFSWDLSCPYLKRSDEGVVTNGLFEWFDRKSSEEKLKIGVAVEKISSILFIYGEDDVSVGVRHLTYFIERLKKANKNNYKCLVYPNSGHMMDPPIFPLCRSSYWPLFKDIFLWGGEAKHHHQAQMDSWNQILKYFESRLNEVSFNSAEYVRQLECPPKGILSKPGWSLSVTASWTLSVAGMVTSAKAIIVITLLLLPLIINVYC